MNEEIANTSRTSVESARPRLLRITRNSPFSRNAKPATDQFSLRRSIRTVVLALLDFSVLTLSLHFLALASEHQSIADSMGRWTVAMSFSAIATILFYSAGLYRRSWRFFNFWHAAFLASLIFGSLLVSWAFILLIPGIRGHGELLIALALNHWLIATALMMGMRAARRAIRERVAQSSPTTFLKKRDNDTRQAILVGSPQWALSVIELLRVEERPSFAVAGVLLPSISDTIARIGGAPVLGSHDMLIDAVADLEARDIRPSLVIACDDGTHLSHREMARLTHRTRELGLELSRVRDCWSHILQRPTSAEPGEISVKDLLGRSEYEMNGEMIAAQVQGECVLVTGAGGTIGGELCWQLASFRPKKIVLLEHSEYHLYSIEMRLRERYPDLEICAELCSIREREDVRRVFARHEPSIVYHAAALKHVPIVENNPCAGVHTNIVGTKIVADAVCEFSARAMVQVSTDKAVNPVGMMGATKRVGELYSQALDLCGIDDPDAPRFMTVRFGNVLGSSGSIVPLFRRQLAEGKPLTVTHPDIERFFMTVREAVQLILQSSSSALEQDSQRGTIFVLDMGKPVRIVDLAYRMISLYGLEPEADVPIKFIGLRPGEKLYEELFDICEEQVESGIKGIFEAQSKPIPLPFITRSIDRLARAVDDGNHEEVRRITHNLVKIPSSGVSFDIFTGKPRLNGTSTGEPLSL